MALIVARSGETVHIALKSGMQFELLRQHVQKNLSTATQNKVDNLLYIPV